MVWLIRWTLTGLTCLFSAVALLALVTRDPGPLAALVPAIIAALGAVGMWIEEINRRRSARKVAVGRCPSCGYDRHGLAHDAPCPECGRGGCLGCGYDRRGLAAAAKCPECGAVPTP